ncbi:MAG: polysaccharide deacetylase family protein [Synergistaceae bacterium]|nr:polysaccharide deacetylase family protein [Synergistaceae bacterium]
MSGLWPNGASCAFAFCFDLDGDTIWNNKTRKIKGGEAFIKSRSVGLYGPRKGADHLLGMMKEYKFKATFFVPGDIADRYSDVVERIVGAGHELAHHGYYHEDSYGDTPEEQLEVIEKSQRVFERVAGKKAVGFRFTGELLPETKAVIYNDKNTLYISSGGLGIEQCSFLTADGVKTKAVGVPCSEGLDEYIQMVFNHYPPIPTGLSRISPYDDVLSNFIRELKGAERFGNAVTSAFHPQVSGTPGKLMIIEKMCQYIAANKIWCASCEEIALWWKKSAEHSPDN